MEGHIRRQHCLFDLKSWSCSSHELAIDQIHDAYHAQVISKLSGSAAIRQSIEEVTGIIQACLCHCLFASLVQFSKEQ